MSPQPDKRHQNHAGQLTTLFGLYTPQIINLGCRIGGATFYFEVPDRAREKLVASGLESPSDVCPDISICYRDYHDKDLLPPALLVVEVFSDSRREYVYRDMTTKPEIYAALEIPTYWIVDRRDNSVWVHTQPSEGKYVLRRQFKDASILPAEGLEFLQISTVQIFNE